jgi:dihydroorotate dehydrogenase
MLKLARIDSALRPILARILPASFFTKLYVKNRSSFINFLEKSMKETIAGDFHKTEVCGLTFRNDLGNAAGLDKDGSLLEFHYKIGAGFAVVGTVLDKPHTGNIVRYGNKDYNPWTPLPNSASALNSLGLPSKGVDTAVEKIGQFKNEFQPKNFPIGVSIMGHPLQEGEEKLSGILECVEKMNPLADFIEINESCPNVAHGSDNADLLKRLTAVMSVAKVPVFVKMGDLGDTSKTLDLMVESGVQGVAGLNTQKDYDYYRPKVSVGDIGLFDYYTKEFNGGISGELIRDRSFEQIKNASEYIAQKNLDLALIHVGGITNSEDVKLSREYAPLREWYTGFMEAISTTPLSEIYKKMLS